MRLRTTIAAIVLTCLSALTAKAQFMTYGTEPASVRWSFVETENYRVIYPRGLDSLARVYAHNLEACREAVSGSIGMAPNEFSRRRLPVVLHPYTAASNGMVTWAPRRMELLTVPDTFDPEPLPWVTQLSIHESRHVAQMQAGHLPKYKVFNILVGELFSGGMAGIYSGPAILEGDAVVAETALTRSGRGRSHDFLSYYRASYAQGESRDYWQWRWGSLRRYTPDYYKIGYLMEAGLDGIWGGPGFARSYYGNIRDRFFPLFNFQKTIKGITGKNLRDTFTEIIDSLTAYWAADAASRAPYTALEQLTPTPKHFTSFYGSAELGGQLYSIRSSLTDASQLVRIAPDGSAKVVSSFAAGTSRLQPDRTLGRLYWSENIADPRWEIASSSDIRYFDGHDTRFLTRGGRYFHPAPSQDGSVAATFFPVEGGSEAVVLDGGGQVLSRFPAPGDIQIVETAWAGGQLYCSGISEEGFGIYRAEDFQPVLPPVHTHIKQLGSHEGRLYFISDRDGAGELYSLSPQDGSVLKHSSTPNGISEWLFAGEQLLVTRVDADGKMLHRAAASEGTAVEFGELKPFPFAETLAGREHPAAPAEVSVSAPRRYSKAAHLLHFHSWAPAYVNIDNISALSFSNMSQNLGLGLTGFFQNDLGSMSGFVAYSGWTPMYGFRHGLHAGFKYSGLYPVIEAKLNVNNRERFDHQVESGKVISTPGTKPYVSLQAQLYIPWTWNWGGWNRGVLPKLSLDTGNDGFIAGRTRPITKLSFSTRAYIIRSLSQSQVYPRWGIGLEAGYRIHPRLDDLYNDNLYAYLYGYIPGLAPTHGIRLTALAETTPHTRLLADSYINTSPRGFNSASLPHLLSAYPYRGKVTVDYALPFAPVDWSFLCPVAYIKGFELILHFDHGFAYGGSRPGGTLDTAGVDFDVRLANLAWIPYDTRIGVSYNYNFGSLFEHFDETLPIKRHFVGMIFSISL